MTIIICMWACYQVCGVESANGERQPSMKLIKSAKINIVHVAHVLVQVQWITGSRITVGFAWQRTSLIASILNESVITSFLYRFVSFRCTRG
jgi:urea transporter